jgi:hypothetical protein
VGGTVSEEEKNAAEIHAEGGTAVVCEGQGATERIDSVTSRESAEPSRSKFAGDELGSTVSERPVFVSILGY